MLFQGPPEDRTVPRVGVGGLLTQAALPASERGLCGERQGAVSLALTSQKGVLASPPEGVQTLGAAHHAISSRLWWGREAQRQRGARELSNLKRTSAILKGVCQENKSSRFRRVTGLPEGTQAAGGEGQRRADGP